MIYFFTTHINQLSSSIKNVIPAVASTNFPPGGKEASHCITPSIKRLSIVSPLNSISLIVAKYLFKLYPKKQEGYLTQLRAKIVSRDHLNKLGSSIGLEDFILYQKSANNYKSLIGNTFEALYGAILIDLGFEKAQKSFEEFILRPHLDIEKIILENRDYKSELLIHFQKKGIKISFETLKDEKSNNSLQFISNIIANRKKIGLGKGSSKKIAEQSASKNALNDI